MRNRLSDSAVGHTAGPPQRVPGYHPWDETKEHAGRGRWQRHPGEPGRGRTDGRGGAR
ncbi:hypothetical protein FRAAL4582 [Frankia alni ACN14a]|uniref:Uncharacterized protein n=1 Tax=Frankia alni (strain DSM 45986 / CECT 9034 / ACN14a) TaxID=326424 RepID=Q0RH11_FRAAA|nr:hypothetical protein FRAAL4582 [Frankia alni ACN14a]